jgi:hypothetical protein
VTDESKPQTSAPVNTAGTPPIIPELVTALFGIVATSLIAGPLVLLFAFGNHFVTTPPFTYIVMYFSSYVGIYVSLPASVINAAIVSLLARRGYDAPLVSLLSGAFIGAAVPIIAPVQEPASTGASAVEMVARQPTGFLGCIVTGALMGLLYWLIAVWWQRQQRLAREAAAPPKAMLALPLTKRDRRIPWDGRIPRE